MEGDINLNNKENSVHIEMITKLELNKLNDKIKSFRAKWKKIEAEEAEEMLKINNLLNSIDDTDEI